MEPGNAESASSFESVREFLERLDGRRPSAEELRVIRPALDDLVARITRLHRMYPACAGVKLSDEVLELVRLAHQQDGLWRSAALF